MSLPREVRDKIYRSLLVASGPIAVYPNHQNLLSEGRPRGELTNVSSLTFGLLRVDKEISIEAAAQFYHHNMFRFGEPQDCHLVGPWDALYSFLLTVGQRNRNNIRYLEVEISRPIAVAKDTDGTISSLQNGSFWLRKVHARDQHNRIYSPVCDQQYLGTSVDCISPAIDAVFRILGPHGSTLQLSLVLRFAEIPGLTFCESGGRSGWSAEVPDYIEQMRTQFTSLSVGDGARVEVLWKGMHFKSEFLSKVKRLEKDGWNVLCMQDFFGPPEKWNSASGPTICFTLRRTGMSGSIIKACQSHVWSAMRTS